MATAPPTRLRTESELYEANRSQWLKDHRGEFVVIKGTELLGFYSDFHVAYCEGVQEYGTNTDFLVKRIALHEPVFVVF